MKPANYKHNLRAIYFALSAVFFWSTVASVFKLALRDYNYIQLLLISNISSLLALFSIILLTRKWKKMKAGINKKDLFRSALFGLINPFIYYLILFKAYSILPAQIAQTINFSWPIILTILSVFFLKERIKATSFLALIISFSGVFMVSTQGQLADFRIQEPFGVILCLISTFIWSTYWILNIKDQRDVVIKLFFNFLFAFFYILILARITGNYNIKSGISIIWPLYIGLFEMGITFYVWLQALKYARNTAQMTNLIYLTPIISLVIIRIVLKENIHLTSIVGLLLIILGIVLQRKTK